MNPAITRIVSNYEKYVSEFAKTSLTAFTKKNYYQYQRV